MQLNAIHAVDATVELAALRFSSQRNHKHCIANQCKHEGGNRNLRRGTWQAPPRRRRSSRQALERAAAPGSAAIDNAYMKE